ncbi:MAG: T9SS type A sorting domain-containing protein [Bacteroidales bacterium]|nr:T9SS type A sorting domain-containing protein [Bacteroidales bacterium]
MKRNFAFITMLLLMNLSHAQILDWAFSTSGTSNDYVECITADNNKNVYISGRFQGTVDFDPSDSVYSLVHIWNQDIFVAKYDSNGAFQWAFPLGNSLYQTTFGMDIDNSGNLLITGGFQGTLDFDPSESNYDLAADGSDLFLAKYDSLSNIIWAFNLGDGGAGYGYDIDVDKYNNIYLVGYLTGSVDMDPSAGTAILPTGGSEDGFLAKYDSNGQFIWARSFGNADDDVCKSISISDSSYIYIGGEFTDSLKIDNSTFVDKSNGGTDLFYGKFDTSGVLIDMNILGGTKDDEFYDIHAGLDEDILIAGKYEDSIDLDPGIPKYMIYADGYYKKNPFLAKYNNKELLWVDEILGDIAYFNRISTSSSGNIYVGGVYQNQSVFNPNDQHLIPEYRGNYGDIFLCVYSENGSMQNLITAGSKSSDKCADIVVVENDLYMTGWFRGDTFYFESKNEEPVLASTGGDDIFVINFNLCKGIRYSFTETICENDSILFGDNYYSETGIYMDTVKVEGNCDSISEIEIIVNPVEEIIIDTSINEGSLYYAQGEYQTETGTYFDTLYTIYGCDSIIITRLSIITGLDNIESENNIKVYPVPVRDFLTIEYDELLYYELYSDTGELLERKHNNYVDFSNYAVGIYYLKIFNNSIGYQTRKIIVIR